MFMLHETRTVFSLFVFSGVLDVSSCLEVYCPRDVDTPAHISKLQQFALGERQEVDVVWRQGRKISSFWLRVCTEGQFPQHTSQAPSTHTCAQWMCRIPERLRGTRS